MVLLANVKFPTVPLPAPLSTARHSESTALHASTCPSVTVVVLTSASAPIVARAIRASALASVKYWLLPSAISSVLIDVKLNVNSPVAGS